MVSIVNSGPRLDRLPISAFHRRVIWLIGIGMFFDGFDIYLVGNVLGALLKTKFSTIEQNAAFISLTFVGMTVGAFVTGFLGDRYGRRFTYQVNLALFGLASLLGAFAPTMTALIALRFLMGAGLGAETVVGYATLTEFVPPARRGRWLAWMVFFVVAGLPVSSLIGTLIIPIWGWRPMFVIAGVGALIVWYLRKSLAESPRWLESVGRTEEAEALLSAIERESAGGGTLPPLSAPAVAPVVERGTAALFTPALLPRLIVGSVVLIVANTLIFGFIQWLPTFFVSEGLSIAKTFGFTLLMSIGAPIGVLLGGVLADAWGRKPTIVAASVATIVLGAVYANIHDQAVLPIVGFLLTIPIYVLVALMFGIYVSELFPTDVRMRGAGIANAWGRAATIVSPFIVLPLFKSHGVAAVLVFLSALLLVQIVVVLTLGIEPNQQTLESVDPEQAAGAPAAASV